MSGERCHAGPMLKADLDAVGEDSRIGFGAYPDPAECCFSPESANAGPGAVQNLVATRCAPCFNA